MYKKRALRAQVAVVATPTVVLLAVVAGTAIFQTTVATVVATVAATINHSHYKHHSDRDVIRKSRVIRKNDFEI